MIRVSELAEERRLLERLVQLPSETLNAEYKSWLDPKQHLDAAKIIRACLALRNRNGGHLVIGFKDRPLEPDKIREPRNIRDLFHADEIQALISNHASIIFEVRTEFVEHEGTRYPVVVVPPGVMVPVAAKADLIDRNSRKKLIAFGAVYFRTLRSNGRVSTSVAKPEDWEEIIGICITNKEGDVARFLRTHFPDFPAALGTVRANPPSPTLRQHAEELLGVAHERFDQTISRRDDG